MTTSPAIIVTTFVITTPVMVYALRGMARSGSTTDKLGVAVLSCMLASLVSLLVLGISHW